MKLAKSLITISSVLLQIKIILHYIYFISFLLFYFPAINNKLTLMIEVQKSNLLKNKCGQFCKNIILNPNRKIDQFFENTKNKVRNITKSHQQQISLKKQNKIKEPNDSQFAIKQDQIFHNFMKKKQNYNQYSNLMTMGNVENLHDVGSQYGDHDYDDDLQNFIKLPEKIKHKNKMNEVKTSKKIQICDSYGPKTAQYNSRTHTTGKQPSNGSSHNLQNFKTKLKQYNYNHNKRLQSQKSLFSKIPSPLYVQNQQYRLHGDEEKQQIIFSKRKKEPTYLNSGYFKQIRNNFNIISKDKNRQKWMKTQVSTPNQYYECAKLSPKYQNNNLDPRKKHQRTKTQNNLQQIFMDYQKIKSSRQNQRKQLKLNLKQLLISPEAKNCKRPFYNNQIISSKQEQTPFLTQFTTTNSNLLYFKSKIEISPKERNKTLLSMQNNQSKNKKHPSPSIKSIKQKLQQLNISNSGSNNSQRKDTKYNNSKGSSKVFQMSQEIVGKTRYGSPGSQLQDPYCQIKYNGIKFKAKIIKSNAQALLKKFKKNQINLMDKNYQSLQKMKKTRSGQNNFQVSSP